jgi:hypothetical protein
MEGARYLEDGRLTIFKRSGGYYARIRLSASSRYNWRSLKTSNEQNAIDLGRRLLFQLEQRAEQGLPPKSKLFAAVIDDYTVVSSSEDGDAAIWVFGSGKLVGRLYDFADNWAIISGDLHYKGTDTFENFFSIVRGTSVLDPGKFITQIGQQEVLDNSLSPR